MILTKLFPVRLDEDNACSNAIDVVGADSSTICSIQNDEDELTDYDFMKGQMIVQALNNWWNDIGSQQPEAS